MAFSFVAAAAVGCEQATQTMPPVPAPIERPTTTLDARSAAGRVLVPVAALIERGGIPGVFVLENATTVPPSVRAAGGDALPQARFRMVKSGKTVGDRIEILSGLAGDETLVLGNLADVHDGSPVSVKR